MTSALLIAPPERPAPPANPQSRPSYTCPECRHVLRASGLERHRYFEPADHPVMSRVCPDCGHAPPGKNPR